MEEFVMGIYNNIIEILPADWEKLVLHTAVYETSNAIYFYIKAEDNEYYSSYDLEQYGIFTEEEYKKVRLAIGAESDCFNKTFEEPWTGYTLVIHSDGRFNIDYEYEEQPIDIPDEWINKYLI